MIVDYLVKYLIYKLMPEELKKKSKMPETLCVIDKRADSGSCILNKLI